MHKPLSTLRKRTTKTKDFRAAAHEMAHILAKEVYRQYARTNVKDDQVVLVPILRAGLALLPACIEKFPSAHVGFIGLKRNEKTLKPKAYYAHVPKLSSKSHIVVLDPMFATGGSAVAAVEKLIALGARESAILFVGVVSAPEGLAKLQKRFPKVRLLIAVHDDKLDTHGYIVPGLGDFGDRYFGTK